MYSILMISSYAEKKAHAIQLRESGLTYREIRQQVPVAKSTLSLWLRSVGLAKAQKQRITEKRIAARKRGSEIWKQRRIDKVNKIRTLAKKAFCLLVLLFIGRKDQKKRSISQVVEFIFPILIQE